MAFLGDPDYLNYRKLSTDDLKTLDTESLLSSYTILKVDFEFPDAVKYPSIACYVDKTCTVYPLRGSSYITGFEYLTALSMGCQFTIHDGVYIPFSREFEKMKNESENSPCFEGFVHKHLRKSFRSQPFYAIMSTVQSNRKQYPKGTLLNNL